MIVKFIKYKPKDRLPVFSKNLETRILSNLIVGIRSSKKIGQIVSNNATDKLWSLKTLAALKINKHATIISTTHKYLIKNISAFFWLKLYIIPNGKQIPQIANVERITGGLII